MNAALGCTAAGLVLAGCAAWAFSGPLSAVILRARWAWRCRKPPARTEGDPLEEWEREELTAIRRSWDRTAPPERSRT